MAYLTLAFKRSGAISFNIRFSMKNHIAIKSARFSYIFTENGSDIDLNNFNDNMGYSYLNKWNDYGIMDMDNGRNRK